MSQKNKAKEFKKQITEKFGSLSAFARIIGMKPYDLKLWIANYSQNPTPEREKKLKALESLILSSSGSDPLEITEEDRQRVKAGILRKYDTYRDFCEDNEEYDVFYLSRFLNGNIKFKTKDKARKLISKFK